jgi:hypothetical protein
MAVMMNDEEDVMSEIDQTLRHLEFTVSELAEEQPGKLAEGHNLWANLPTLPKER